MPRQYSEETRIEALELYAALGPNEAARRMSVSKGTIMTWAKRAGITAPVRAGRTVQVRHERVTYHKERRLIVLDRLFEEVERSIQARAGTADETISPGDLQKLATATAILIDKRRLEEGVEGATGPIDLEATLRAAQARAQQLLSDSKGNVRELPAAAQARER
jgi:hypothetical protein